MPRWLCLRKKANRSQLPGPKKFNPLESSRARGDIASSDDNACDANSAVLQSLRERLARRRHERDSDLADRLIRSGKECADRIKKPYRSLDPAEMLYHDQ
jgi:hypothetical protein